MSDPAAAITAAYERHSLADATARETAVALAVEREQKVNATGEVQPGRRTTPVASANDQEGNE